MLAFFAAALAAAPAPASATPATPSAATPATPVLESAAPWWERITVTVDDKGAQQSCRYETSASPGDAAVCDKAMAASIKPGNRSGATTGLYTKLTFERRFSPGNQLDAGRLQPGDTLLGREVMFLTIDAKGSIQSCKVVAATGEATPDYDCEDARKEQFRATASAAPVARQAFMTVLAYGHTELAA